MFKSWTMQYGGVFRVVLGSKEVVRIFLSIEVAAGVVLFPCLISRSVCFCRSFSTLAKRLPKPWSSRERAIRPDPSGISGTKPLSTVLALAEWLPSAVSAVWQALYTSMRLLLIFSQQPDGQRVYQNSESSLVLKQVHRNSPSKPESYVAKEDVSLAHHWTRYNHYVSRRYLRLVKLLAEAETDPKDLGYCWWSTAIGLVTDQLVGHGHDDDFVRLICDTEIGVFKLRALGDPLGDWVPLIRVSQALVGKLTSGLRYVVNRAGLPIPRLLRNANEEKCDVLRRNQTKYCRAQLGSLTRRVGNGDTTPSQLGDLFRALPEPLSDHDQFQLITTLSGSGMAIGTTLTWLVGYLASHPALQDVAFSAIQEVYSGEVPDPHDTDRVEYLKAMALEAGRYWTAIRLGFLRETNSDSSIDEYFVPKGTIVVYNSFQINRDPAAYDSPDMFLPERWMNGRQGRTDVEGIVGDKIGVPHMGHGAGRRLCLGVPSMFFSSQPLVLRKSCAVSRRAANYRRCK